MKSSSLLLILFLLATSHAMAQNAPPADPPKPTADVAAAPSPQDSPSPDTPESTKPEAPDQPASETTAPPREPDVAGKAKELAEEAKAKAEQLAQQFDRNDTAKEATEGLLGPIYLLAESLSSAAFHWVAFALMAAGVVSFALQLVLGKLVVLFKGSINVREILSDLIGFLISALGLVLTTQAAAENSTFTDSPFSVLSAATLGVVVGFTLYVWGQAQEVNAVTGQRAAKVQLPKT